MEKLSTGPIRFFRSIANPTTLRFDTGAAADTARPSIATVDPANGATGVATDAPVRVGFSERVSPTGVNTASFRLLHSATFAQISATVTLAPDGRSATLVPSSPLAGGTNYRVDLTTSEITDLAGQTLIPFASSFLHACKMVIDLRCRCLHPPLRSRMLKSGLF